MSTNAVIPSQLNPLEYFVDADAAAEFLHLQRRLVLDWSRKGAIPAHPLGEGKHRVWRYLLSELAEWARNQHNGFTPGASLKKGKIQ